MTDIRKGLMYAAVCGLGAAIGIASVNAKDELPKSVRRALAAENRLSQTVAGHDRRQQLEGEFLRAKANDPETYWHAGYVKVNDRWVPCEQADQAITVNANRREYEQRRSETLRTVQAQAEFATWCSRNGFVEQSQAHNYQAVLLSPLNADVSTLYRRMNYMPANKGWLTRQEVFEAYRELVDYCENLERVMPIVQRFADDLERGRLTETTANQRIRQLATTANVPALEVALTRRSEISSKAAVSAFRQVPTYQAAQALARVAALSPWLFVREAAVESLKERYQEDFVPQWLAMLQVPIQTEFQRFVAGRHVGMTCLIGRETDFSVEITQLTVWATQPIRRPVGRKDAAQLRQYYSGNTTAIINAAEIHARKFEVQNDSAEVINERIIAGLSAVGGQSFGDNPRRCWDWWQEQNGFDPTPASAKRIRIVKEDEAVNVPLPPPPLPIPSCLVAGTLIWTDQGLVPIERIQPGDRVLSKHVETGELTHKVVLHTTVRLPVPITKFQVGDDSIQATSGHHFWVSGAGWRKTRELAVEQPLHTATGAIRIGDVEAAEKAPVFNLVVADFHTYFVGKNAVLCHDVLPPKPTNKVVPGLDDE